MEMKLPSDRILASSAALVAILLVVVSWQNLQIKRYNAAVEAENFAAAANYPQAEGVFAQAFDEHSNARYQQARILYSELEASDDDALRVAALFNMGNTYMQQARQIDLETDPDLAAPLIELAKVSYREVLSIDSAHWNAKYNLERALQWLPDSRDLKLMELDGLQNPVRTVISAETEEILP